MQFTDSHIHLQDYKANSAQQIIAEMQKLGFVKVICPSSNPVDWHTIAEIAQSQPNMIIPAFGVHPWYLTEAPQDWLKQLKSYLQLFPQAQIGECGLDRLKAPSEKGQREFFSLQIELAKEFSRPLNIHALKANSWIEEFLPVMPHKFMLHSFNGSPEFLHNIIRFGGYISISANILKSKNSTAIIKAVPLNKLLLESDGPWLSDYISIPEFASYIATLHNIETSDLVEQIYANFKEFNHVE